MYRHTHVRIINMDDVMLCRLSGPQPPLMEIVRVRGHITICMFVFLIADCLATINGANTLSSRNANESGLIWFRASERTGSLLVSVATGEGQTNKKLHIVNTK